MSSFSGKVIAITGAASGIGLATAHLLASRGASISLADINYESLEVASTAIQTAHPSVQILIQRVNVVQRQEVDSWLDATVSRFGRLDGAANIAGVIGTFPPKKLQDMEDDEWDRVLNVNLKGVLNCIRSQLQRMHGEEGSIVNASSVAGLTGWGGGTAYTTSKHAVIGLTRSAASDVGERNIRVNCVAPGWINTPIVPAAPDSQVAFDFFAQRLAIKRIGQPEEIACLFAFLLGDESKYITGAVYTIDGGWLS